MYCINFCSYFFIKRWVWAYRKDRFNVAINTNNGIKRQNWSFKYDFLAKQRDTSLSGMLTVLVTQFLPSSFRRFVLCNSILLSISRYILSYIAFPAFPYWTVTVAVLDCLYSIS